MSTKALWLRVCVATTSAATVAATMYALAAPFGAN